MKTARLGPVKEKGTRRHGGRGKWNGKGRKSFSKIPGKLELTNGPMRGVNTFLHGMPARCIVCSAKRDWKPKLRLPSGRRSSSQTSAITTGKAGIPLSHSTGRNSSNSLSCISRNDPGHCHGHDPQWSALLKDTGCTWMARGRSVVSDFSGTLS